MFAGSTAPWLCSGMLFESALLHFRSNLKALNFLHRKKEQSQILRVYSCCYDYLENLTKIIGQKSESYDVPKTCFCSLLLKNFLRLFLVCGIIKIAKLGTSFTLWVLLGKSTFG